MTFWGRAQFDDGGQVDNHATNRISVDFDMGSVADPPPQVAKGTKPSDVATV